jgi:RHS repeat-associated protein
VRTHYNPQTLTLLAPQRSRWQRSLTWLLIVTLVLLDVPLPGPRTTVTPAHAHGQASRIFTIEPSCAQPGDTVTITGNGFGAENVEIYVGGQETGHGVITGGLRAQLLSAYGNRATFIVPQNAPGGVSIVWAVNPGSHAGFSAFRVKQTEICGNSVDEDCDGQLDDVDICVPVNRSPLAEAGFPQTAPVGTTIHLDGTGSSDPDGDLLSFQWSLVSQPTGSTATLTDATTATPSFTIDQPGNYTVALRVSDGQVSSTPDTVVISTLNSRPVANAGAAQHGYVGDVLTLNGSGSSDVDGDSLTYQWSLATPSTSTATLNDPSSVTPSFTLDVFGAYTAQLTVHDGTVASLADSVVIDTFNSPPVAQAGADTAGQVGQTITLDGSGSSDVDGNALTYQWGLVTKPTGSSATLQDATTATPSFIIDRAGTYSAQLVVNDGLANSQPDTVTISTLNTKPVADAGPAQSGTVGTSIHLDGSASSDVDGDSLTYQWSLLSQPATSTATLQNPTSVTPQYTLDKAGTYVAQLIVEDGTVSSEPTTVTISTLNSAPVANAGAAQSGTVGTTITLDGSGSSDVDGDALTYQWSFTSTPANSTATLSSPTAVSTTFVLDKPGTYTAQLLVHDGTVLSKPATVTITTLNSKPVAQAGTDQAVLTGSVVQLSGSGSHDVDTNPLTYQWDILSQPATSTATLTNPTAVNPTFTPDLAGLYVVQLIVNDGTLDSDPDTVTITVTDPDTTPPPPANLGLITTSSSGGQTTVTGAAGSVEGGAQVKVTNTATNQQVTVTATADGSFSAVIGAQPGNTLTLLVTDSAGNSSVPSTTQVEPLLPPDPASVAPPLDRTVATTVFDATAFLYSGSNPIQTGVAAGTIEAKRIAVIRGKVLKKDNNPLSGVTITVLNHPELGQTLSRSDGMFDMAVNGGGVLTVNYAKPGYLPAQRQIDAPWQDYAFLPDVVLIQPDPHVTTIDLTDTTQPMQVAAGSPVTDADGTRQAVVMIPQGTTATLVLPDGSTQPLTTLNVRLTEYTVGANGPAAMPGALPPTSGYTYAVQLRADEASAAGGARIVFSQPLPLYIDNFLNMPVGTAVPVGAYDPQQAVWVAQPNGQVLKVVGVTAGEADLDVNGDGVAESAATLSALGISAAERQQLATRYPLGRSVWRALAYYTSEIDCNWPFRLPADTTAPNGPPLGALGAETARVLDTPDARGGIAYQNQTLGQHVASVGMPFTLHYQSDRVPGRSTAYLLTIPLSGASIPASVQRIDLQIQVAGQRIRQSFTPQPNLSTTFTWNGQDAYGRTVQGHQPVEVQIEFVYEIEYLEAAPGTQVFGQVTDETVPVTVVRRAEYAQGRIWQGEIGAWDARALGVGGWSLDVHHTYDPVGLRLNFGDGTQRSSQDADNGNLGESVQSFAGGGTAPLSPNAVATAIALGDPRALTVAPDGSVYIADMGLRRILRVDPAGRITTVAGGGTNTVFTEGAQATTVRLSGPMDVALGTEGSLYIAENGVQRIYRVDPTGRMFTVAGAPSGTCSSGEGVLATSACVPVNSVAVAPDGSVYIGSTVQRRLRRVGPDGLIWTVAGTGFSGLDEGTPALTSKIVSAEDVAVGPDGTVYFLNSFRIHQIGADGILRRVAGTGNGSFTPIGDGGPATQGALTFPEELVLGPEGSIYVADSSASRIRRITPDGIITTIVGNGVRTTVGEHVPDTAPINAPFGIGLAADGTLYYTENNNLVRVRRARPVLPGFSAVGDFVLPASDGSEVYVFNSRGRHLRTINPHTNSLIYSFGYDANGKLSTVTDANTNVTTITRDASGNVTGITGPYNQSNGITLDANGYLASLTNPNGETTSFSYTADGLLTSATPPGKPASSFQYDSGGRLIQTSDPAGGGDTLTRSSITNGYQVQHSTAAGEQSTYKVEYLPDGQQKRTNVLPDGTQQTTLIGTDGKQTITQPDGISQTVSVTGDPRFGLQSPIPTNLNVTTPGGKTGTLTNTRTATLSDPNNPLSLTSQTDTVNFNGRTAMRTYNATTRTATDTSPAGRIRTTVTDGQGRVTQQQQGTLAPTSFAYDTRGRLASRSQGGRNAAMTYDSLGRLGTITDSANHTVQFQYDSAGRVTQQTLPDNRVITYTYDASGNVTAITPPGRPPHEFTYTAVNLEKDYLAPFVSSGGTNTTQYAYDVDRKLTRITRPDGQQVQLNYDGAGRLQSQSFPSPQSPVPGLLSYSYNPQGNLSAAAFSGGGSVSYTYDGSLLLSSTWSGPVTGSVTWTYDNNYRKTSQSVNGSNTVTFTYDADDLLTGAGAMTLTRDNVNGLLSGTTLGTVTDAMTYNSLGEVATAQASVGGSAILNETYTRDSLGRISQKAETIQGMTTTYGYTYDVTGRLTTVTHNGATVSTYSYDSNGNRLSKVAPASTITYTYDDQDRLLTQAPVAGPPSVSYTYTANGELASKTSPQPLAPSTYQYDALGNLRSATLGDGTTIGYVIDGENRRIGKTVNGSLVQGFLYENQLEPVAELDGAGNLVSRFVYCGCGAGNIPQYMLKNGVTYRIIADHLGSPRLVVDSTTGAIMQRMDYDEFGNVILDTNPGFQPFGFAGGIYDRDTGLVRHGARDYEPETGRWTAKDPIRFDGGMNFYGYVSNDPINHLDLRGLNADAISFGVGFGIASTLGSISLISLGKLAAAGILVAAAAWSAVHVVNILSASGQGQPKYPGNDPTQAPGEGWEWRGNGSPGSGQGSWYNPNTGESLHPDFGHPAPIGPHWDYVDKDKKKWRLFPDGTIKPKVN